MGQRWSSFQGFVFDSKMEGHSEQPPTEEDSRGSDIELKESSNETTNNCNYENAAEHCILQSEDTDPTGMSEYLASAEDGASGELHSVRQSDQRLCACTHSCHLVTSGRRQDCGRAQSGRIREERLSRRTFKTLSLTRRHRAKTKTAKEIPNKKKNGWAFKFKLKPTKSEIDIPDPLEMCPSCVCTGYRRTEEHHLGAGVVFHSSLDKDAELAATSSTIVAVSSLSAPVPLRKQPIQTLIIDLSKFNPEAYPTEDFDECARQERAREMREGIDPPPGFQLATTLPLTGPTIDFSVDDLTALFHKHLSLGGFQSHPAFNAFAQSNLNMAESEHLISHFAQLGRDGSLIQRTVHTQVDYIHCLVPDLLQITNCSFYWGKMDRYEAEKQLENKPEGTFLLRDSAQEEYLFSVSFRRYSRSLHARIEQWNHKFSFDSHDPGVFASTTVCGLIEHYKDPSSCMFFEPMLTIPLHRSCVFPLQHLCRATICSNTTYDGINQLKLPKPLKSYLKEYHYKQRVRVRRFEMPD